MIKKTIDLLYPIPVKGENGRILQVKQIELGRLKAKHLKLLPKSLMDDPDSARISPEEILPIVAGITGLPAESVDEIDIDDLKSIIAEMKSFLSVSPEGGKKPSGASQPSSTSLPNL